MEWRAATVVGAIPLGPSRERRTQLSRNAKAGTIADLRLQDYSVPSLDLGSAAHVVHVWRKSGGASRLGAPCWLLARRVARPSQASHIPDSGPKKKKVLR